jgi:hypothetical protein
MHILKNISLLYPQNIMIKVKASFSMYARRHPGVNSLEILHEYCDYWDISVIFSTVTNMTSP